MRCVLVAFFLVAAAISPTGVAAQDDHPPATGCTLPRINEMVSSIFGHYAAVYHASGSNPGAQSKNGMVRIFAASSVSCMFFRSAPPSEALFVILRSYANTSDASKAFHNDTLSAKAVHQDGKLQFADSPGKVLAYDNETLLSEVRWASAQGPTNNSVPGEKLEPIARQALNSK